MPILLIVRNQLVFLNVFLHNNQIRKNYLRNGMLLWIRPYISLSSVKNTKPMFTFLFCTNPVDSDPTNFQLFLFCFQFLILLLPIGRKLYNCPRRSGWMALLTASIILKRSLIILNSFSLNLNWMNKIETVAIKSTRFWSCSINASVRRSIFSLYFPVRSCSITFFSLFPKTNKSLKIFLVEFLQNCKMKYGKLDKGLNERKQRNIRENG